MTTMLKKTINFYYSKLYLTLIFLFRLYTLNPIKLKAYMNYFRYFLLAIKMMQVLITLLQSIVITCLTCIRLYRALCYMRILSELLPFCNFQIWPFNIAIYLTTPYFNFWKSIFKPVVVYGFTINFSFFLGLETLNTLEYILSIIYGFFLTYDEFWRKKIYLYQKLFSNITYN